MLTVGGGGEEGGGRSEGGMSMLTDSMVFFLAPLNSLMNTPAANQ